jgi:hypothetical protein
MNGRSQKDLGVINAWADSIKEQRPELDGRTTKGSKINASSKILTAEQASATGLVQYPCGRPAGEYYD